MCENLRVSLHTSVIHLLALLWCLLHTQNKAYIDIRSTWKWSWIRRWLRCMSRCWRHLGIGHTITNLRQHRNLPSWIDQLNHTVTENSGGSLMLLTRVNYLFLVSHSLGRRSPKLSTALHSSATKIWSEDRIENETRYLSDSLRLNGYFNNEVKAAWSSNDSTTTEDEFKRISIPYVPWVSEQWGSFQADLDLTINLQ